MASLRFVLLRFRRQWPVRLAILAAATLAAALFSSAPLGSLLVTEMGLRQALAAAGAAERNVLIASDTTLDEALFGEIDRAAGWLLAGRVIVHEVQEEARRPRVTNAGQPNRWLGLISVPFPEQWIEVVEGRLPVTPTLGMEGCDGTAGGAGCCVQHEAARNVVVPSGPLPFTLPVTPSVSVEALANADLAAALGVRVGDLVPLASTPNYVLKIVGLGRPRDPAAAPWTALAWESNLFAGPQPDFPGLAGGLHVGRQDYGCLAAVTGQPLRLVALSGLAEHVRVLQGRLPELVPPGEDAAGAHAVLEMATGPRAAAAAGIPVGGRLLAGDGLEIRLVGLVEPLDAAEDYWMGSLLPFEGDPGQGLLAGLVLPEALSGTGERGEAGPGRRWRLLVDPSRIRLAEGSRVEEALSAIEAALRARDPAAQMDTGLAELIRDARARLASVRAVLLWLMGAVLALIVTALAAAARPALSRDVDELALLSARGAGRARLLRLRLVEGFLLCLPAAALGPTLAVWGVRWLPALAGLPLALPAKVGTGTLSIAVTPEARRLALAAAGLCLLALLIAARRRREALPAAVARPPVRAAWQRVYLDLLLLALGGALYWSLRSGSSFLPGWLRGAQAADPLLLLAPAVLLVAGALVLLRLFSPALRWAGQAAGQARGVPGLLGVWQVGRDLGRYAPPVLLVALAVSLGLVAVLYRGSLAISRQEQAHYAAGADLRLTWWEPPAGESVRALTERYASLDGIRAASVAYRREQAGDGLQPGALLLGVEPVSFAQVARYAPGQSAYTIPKLMGVLAGDDAAAAAGLELPGRPVRLGLWLRPVDEASAQVSVQAWLRDADQRWWTVDLAAPVQGGWQFLEGAVTGKGGATPAYPLRWIALSFRTIRPQPPTSVDYHRARFLLDAVQIRQAGGEKATVADFEQPGGWSLPSGPGGLNRLTFEPAAGAGTDGGQALDVQIRFSTASPVQLLTTAPPAAPVQAIASWPFLRARNLQPGDVFEYPVGGAPVRFVAAAVVGGFPSAAGAGAGDGAFLICNLERLRAELSPSPGIPPPAPTEVWLEVTGEEGRASAVQALAAEGEVLDAQAWLSRYPAEPVAQALGGGLLLAFLAAWGPALAGLAAYATSTARQRQPELRVLRTIGLSSGQVLQLLLAEQALVMGLGLVAGTLLGPALALLVQPALAAALDGGPGAVPIVIRADWPALAWLYAGLIASLAAVLAAMGRLLAPLPAGESAEWGE